MDRFIDRERLCRKIRQLDELIQLAPDTMVEDLCEQRMDLQEELSKLQIPNRPTSASDPDGYFCDSNIMI